MPIINIKKYKLWQYTVFFFGYSFIGYLYETILEVFIYRWGFSNRGIFFGPYLPVYGVGALMFIILWYNLIENKSKKTRLISLPLIFILTMISASLLELLATYLLEFTIGYWPWQTYSAYPINFQGRIALNPSIRFGLGGIIFLYYIQPLFENMSSKISNKKGNTIAVFLVIIFMLDVIYTLLSSGS